MALISGYSRVLEAAFERSKGRHIRHVLDLLPEYKRNAWNLRLQSSGNKQTGMKASCRLLLIIYLSFLAKRTTHA